MFSRPHQLGLLMRALLVVAVVWARHVFLVILHLVLCLLTARQVLLVKMPLVVLLLAARLVLLVTMPLVCFLELSLVLAVLGLAQDRVQQRFVDAGLLDRSSWSLTLPGVWASSSPRQRRLSWLLEATSGSPRPTVGALPKKIMCGSPLGSCPLVGGKPSTWCRGKRRRRGRRSSRSPLLLFACHDAPRAAFLPVVFYRLVMLGIMAVLDQKYSYVDIGGMLGWFCLCLCTLRCVSFLVFWPEMLGITAGMDQKEYYVLLCSRSSSQVVGFLLRCRGLFPWSCCSADHRVSQLLRYMWLTSLLCRSCRFPGGLQFSDTLTTCPLLSTTGAWRWTVSKIAEVPQLQFFNVRRFPRRGA